jgi:hypothetical protein
MCLKKSHKLSVDKRGIQGILKYGMSENVFMFVINQPCEEQRFPHELLQ